MRKPVVLSLLWLSPAAAGCGHVSEFPVDGYYMDGSAAVPGDSVEFQFVPRGQVSQVTAVQVESPELGMAPHEVFRTDDFHYWSVLRTGEGARSNPDRRSVAIHLPSNTEFRGLADLVFTVSYRRPVPVTQTEFEVESGDVVVTLPLTIIDGAKTFWKVKKTLVTLIFSLPYLLGLALFFGLVLSRPSLSDTAAGWISFVVLGAASAAALLKFSTPTQAVWGSQSGWVTSAWVVVWVVMVFLTGMMVMQTMRGRIPDLRDRPQL